MRGFKCGPLSSCPPDFLHPAYWWRAKSSIHPGTWNDLRGPKGRNQLLSQQQSPRTGAPDLQGPQNPVRASSAFRNRIKACVQTFVCTHKHKVANPMGTSQTAQVLLDPGGQWDNPREFCLQEPLTSEKSGCFFLPCYTLHQQPHY